jgi:hypothetical protein
MNVLTHTDFGVVLGKENENHLQRGLHFHHVTLFPLPSFLPPRLSSRFIAGLETEVPGDIPSEGLLPHTLREIEHPLKNVSIELSLG